MPTALVCFPAQVLINANDGQASDIAGFGRVGTDQQVLGGIHDLDLVFGDIKARSKSVQLANTLAKQEFAHQGFANEIAGFVGPVTAGLAIVTDGEGSRLCGCDGGYLGRGPVPHSG